MSSPTIIIAEDHPMFRGALALTLRRLMPEAQLIEVASHGDLEAALASGPDVKIVLLDLRIPGANGLSSLVFLRGEYPEVAVAIISGGAYAETISRARQLGAAAFIPKSASTDTIAQALAGVIRGESWFPEHEALPAASEPRLQDQLTTLTPQQFRVLKYLADGKLNKQTQDTNFLSTPGVPWQVASMTVVNLYGQYNFARAFQSHDLHVRLGARNLFNRSPPLESDGYNGALYVPYGRYLYASVGVLF